MANYPALPRYLPLDASPADVYNELVSWANQLGQELDTRDSLVDNRPSTKFYAVTTVTEIGRPQAGDIAYSKDEEKFKGYVSSTGWVDFH
tara:strand:- start:26 stop:295 length:270 start_codon:yes stop_codon:yes gene_type:complete